MRADRSLILSTSVGVLFHAAVLLSVFLLLAGHNAPGGGFVGGLVAGAAAVLRYVDAGPDAVGRAVRVAPRAFLGTGLALAILTGAVPWSTGSQFLESAKLTADVPLLGTLEATSALLFDVGVYLVVVGLVLAVLELLGGEPER
ncbi:MAG: MnhB domain-containing protein [Acidimicrobiales bacterium]